MNNITTHIDFLESKMAVLAVYAVVLGFAGYSPARAQTVDRPTFSPIGTNISINGIVYYVQAPAIGGAMPINPPPPTLTAYTSAAVFLSYGFNSWAAVASASADDIQLTKNGRLMPYADGSLVNDNGTIYVISNGAKHGVTTASVFLSLGYKWINVIYGNASFMPDGAVISAALAHAPGTLVNQNGTIYYISNFGKMGFPSLAVFNSWGFNLKNVVPANGEDMALSKDSIVSAWTLGQLSPVVGLQMLIPVTN